MEIEQLKQQIKIVAQARQEQMGLEQSKKKLIEEWELQNKELLARLEYQKTTTAMCEAKLRDLTLQSYAETGNKSPAPGIGIREITKLDYNPKVALKWAMEHQIALSLDKKSFEGFAKATPLDFVTITQEPQATIASVLEVK